MLKATGNFAGGNAQIQVNDNGSVVQEDSPTRRGNTGLNEVSLQPNTESLASTVGSKQMTRNALNDLSTPEGHIYRTHAPTDTYPLSPMSGVSLQQQDKVSRNYIS